ncbi:hypothetical protein [Aequorivita capsosiphonis]|uniref:hypothetical protein n=1 Tax=Aequorivita capsosiphonis TaxID=487317 RepID=UPI000426863E|nr:hypothetical protein [Aequorivita capsosiphonis]
MDSRNEKGLNNSSQKENLDFKRLVDIISNYLFTEKEPLRDEVIAVMNERPSL